NSALEETDFQLEYEFNSTSRYHLEGSINDAMMADIFLIVGLMFFFFIVIMLLAYRSWFAMLYLIGIVGLSMGLSLFVYMLVDAPLNLISVMIIPVTVVLSAANAVHLLTGFFSQDKALSNIERIKIAYQKYFLPSLLTSFTTSIAFFSLCFNETGSVSTLGWITGVSILLSFMACYAVSPFLFQFAPAKQLIKHKFLDISDFFIKRKKAFSFILMPILLIAIVLLPKLTFKNNFELFIPIGSKEQIEQDQIRNNYFSQATLDVLVDLQDTMNVAERTIVLKKELEGLEDVVSVRCAERNSIIMTKFFMPVDIAKVTGYNEKFTKQNGQLQRFQIGVKNPDDLSKLELNIDKLMAEKSGITHLVASVVLTYQNVNTAVGKSLIYSLVTSTLVLFLVFFFLTRSFPQSLIGLFVNLVPLSLIVIIFVGFDLHLNILTAITAVVCLGIIVDDTIHSFYRRVVRKKPLGELSFGMLTTTLILVVGFGIFSISNIRPVGIFGGVAAIIFIVTLISDFTLLLYLIDLYDKYLAKKEKNKVN
ncbi:MMPL family transporter, partial [Saprospiraceae bacterium]|nr:MMPL family transporter [Saprospiraceae bacterium]